MNEPVTSELPLVSILLPNLNYRRFLDARFESILAQTYQNWEVVVVDSYSDDGAWELIQAYAARDKRIRTSQAPREGIYAGLNRCLSMARGEYIYIATSDDTMMPDCLAEMVAALRRHRDCDICHCQLEVIDENGHRMSGKWEWRQYPVARYFADLLDKEHIRPAPHDGILHCAVYTVFTSLTQILTRRSLFEDTGPFKTDIGEGADFEWGMRASLTCSVVHLPKTLATWRVHSEHITSNAPNPLETAASHASLSRMVTSAFDSLENRNPVLRSRLAIGDLRYPYQRLQVEYGFWEQRDRFAKIGFLLKMLGVNVRAVASFVTDTYIFRREFDACEYARNLIRRLDCGIRELS